MGKIADELFADGLETLDKKTFYICAVGTIVSLLLGAVFSSFYQDYYLLEHICIALSVIYLALIILMFRIEKYYIGNLIMCIILNELAIPSFYFFSGGSSGVATCFMIMGIIFPCILLKQKEFKIVFSLVIATDIFLFLIEFWMPQLISEGMVANKKATGLMAVVMVSAVLSFVVRNQFVLYHKTNDMLRKSMEEEHKAREEAEIASKKKNEFLSNMSHEIRTPMNAIVGIANLLRDEKLTPLGQDYLATLITSSQSLLQIIDDLLDYSKMVEKKLTLDVKEYDIGKLGRELQQMVEFQIQNKPEIGLRTEFGEDIPCGLEGDVSRIRQICLNLLSNAVKFTDKGIVTFKIEWLADSLEKGTLKIVVSDTGRGIKEAEQKRIFDAFEQIDGRVNRSKDGSGLGLAICKMLVDMMQGELTLESRFGFGSTFTVTIPSHVTNCNIAVFEVPKRKQADNIISFQAPKAKVLVVDDNKVNLRVASALLKRYDMEAVSVESGMQAVNMLSKNNDFDIILMDYMMPEMDGIETTKIIQQKGIHIPVVALTANTIEGAQDMYLDAGMVGYIPKPIKLEDLDQVLSRWIPPEKQHKQAN